MVRPAPSLVKEYALTAHQVAVDLFVNSSPCVAICTPMRMDLKPYGARYYHPISPLFHRFRHNLQLPTCLNFIELEADGMEVGDARSHVAAHCLALPNRPRFLFFIDSDVLVPCDALCKLLLRADCHPEHSVYCGVYCCKGHEPAEPLIYGERGQGALWNWTVGDLLTTQSHGVKSAHMGLTMIRVQVLQDLLDAGLVHGDGTDQEDCPFFKTVNRVDPENNPLGWLRHTEDTWFYWLLERLGKTMLVDTSVLAGHVDVRTGIVWGLPENMGPVPRAHFLQQPQEGPKLALDIGAGPVRRQQEGYKFFTLDVRKEAGCDYVQDVRGLNIPGQSYDLVCCSHTLEHLPYADQDKAWKELFRVCKPGGLVEIALPNAEWAAARLIAGVCDLDVQGVLMGGQGRNDIPFAQDTHYTAYSPGLAVAFAQGVGFHNVQVRSFRDTPALGANLVLTGERPGSLEPSLPAFQAIGPCSLETPLLPSCAQPLEITNQVRWGNQVAETPLR
jgi:predicted SAM-dependent methyltransferase